MPEQTRTAIVGLGNVSQDFHLPIVDRFNKTELVAICDKNERLLGKYGSKYDVSAYTDVQEMIKNEIVESVHVCTPPHTHADIGEEVMSNDIPVLIEKPATTDVEGLERLIEIANQHTLPSSVVHNQLFFPCVRNAIKRVNNGEIGEVSSVTMIFSEPRNLRESPRGNWVFDLPGAEIGEGIVHQIYLPLAFISDFGEVRTFTKQNFSGYDNIDFDGLLIEIIGANERQTATIKILTTAEHRSVLLIHGTEGDIQIDLNKRAVINEGVGTDEETTFAEIMVNGSLAVLQQLSSNLMKQSVGEVQRRIYDKIGHEKSLSHHGHYWLIKNYVEAIQEGGTPPVSFKEALETIRVLEKIGNSD